ncbi:Peptidyl-prolyl cis-trans isomerase fpr2 [Maublancomyces gigas]|uniref:peptidylprolyl isomerase n=1 Tax=Discina gigas TaxID=1032678 RepID=A0ABR3GNT5_9PEZI
MRVLSVASFVISTLLASVAADELQILTTKEVDCDRKTAVGDTIHVNYRGTLESNGEQFDSSYDRNQPFSFKLGAGGVIKGWDLGLLDMCIGEERKLTIPYQLAYGERGMPPVIPPSSTLVFETALVGIAGYDPERQEL